MQYFYPPTGVKFYYGRQQHTCAMCVCTPEGMNRGNIDDWLTDCTLLQSVWLKITDQCIMLVPSYCMLIQMKEVRIILEALSLMYSLYIQWFYYRAACNADAVLWWEFCLSLRPSVTRVYCDKTEERSVQIYIPYERTFSLLFWEEEWLVGGDPFYLKFWVNRPPLEQNRRFSTNNRS